MIGIQDATRNASTQSLQLEEVESGNEGGRDVWRITLSMPESPATDPLAALRRRREYKIFAVVKSTGEVLSMKIRELAND